MQINLPELEKFFGDVALFIWHQIDWILVQKIVLSSVLLSFEHWLSVTEKVQAGSTVQLVLNSIKYLASKKDGSNGPKI